MTRLNILILTGAVLAGAVDAVLVLGAVVAAVVAVLSVLELQAITIEDSNPMQIRLLAMLLTDPFNTNNSFMIAIIKLRDGRFNRG
ncbi:hypothetical protein LJR153_005726 [Paenibacillus sp. LjRoot153]